MFRNKTRFLLTLTGITIGLFVYLLGNAAVDGYINSLYKEAYDFDENSFLVYDEEGRIIEEIQKYDDNLSVNRCNIIGSAYTVNKDYQYKNIEVINSVNLIGLDAGVSDTAIPYIGDEHISLARAEILYGTDFSEENIKKGDNCIIIERSTAVFWFQKENAVGEYLDVISPDGYDRFVVAAVIEDLPSRRRMNLEFNKLSEQGNAAKYSNTSAAYTTYNYVNNMGEESSIEERYIVNTGLLQNGDIDGLIDELSEKSVVYDINAGIVSQNRLVKDVRNLEIKIHGFINAIIVVLIVISGFMIVTVYIFSVKERTYEIGVRRALGASETDIVCQFIIEGIITALTAGIVTLLFGVIICNLATSYLIGKLYMEIRLVLSGKLILSMFGISVLQGIVFCFIPALTASKIRPTEAIRWD